MKNTLYRVFVGNKWTSTLIIFSILEVLMIFWTIKEDGPWALDLTDPMEFMLLPIIFSALYLIYRFLNDRHLGDGTYLGSGAGLRVEETKKAVLNLVARLIILFVIAIIVAVILYYYLLSPISLYLF